MNREKVRDSPLQLDLKQHKTTEFIKSFNMLYKLVYVDIQLLEARVLKNLSLCIGTYVLYSGPGN